MHLYSLGPVTYNNDEISFMTGICFWRGRQIFLSSDQIYNRSEQIFKEAAEQILAKPWPVGLVGWVGRLLLASVVPPVLQPPCTLSSHFGVSCSSLNFIYKYIENISSIAPLPSSVNKLTNMEFKKGQIWAILISHWVSNDQILLNIFIGKRKIIKPQGFIRNDICVSLSSHSALQLD